jgi:uncharacterized membrane protein YfhO
MKLKRKLFQIDYLLAWLLPILIVMLAYFFNGIYWGSSKSILASDAFTQTINFYDSFHDVLHGQASIFYSWNAAWGLNYLGLYSYYLGGPVTFLVYFFKKTQMVNAVYLLTLIKFGLIGLSSFWFAKKTFALKNWQRLILSLSYSLMSFGMAYAEQPMWLDTLYILPLVIAGIDDLIFFDRVRLLFFAYILLFITNFYLAYMVGIFSLFYFWAFSWAQRKISFQKVFSYFKIVILSLLGSSWLILPVIFFMQRTHEPLSKVTGILTDNAGIWDLIIKNMVGVYDTTKYGTVPFVYIGILPLLLAISFFFQKDIAQRLKICFGFLLLIILAGFYFQIIDLTWQGWHAPSMFLYRYSFLWSFLTFLLAGKAWEKLLSKNSFIKICLVYLLILVAAYLGSFGHYHYAGNTNFVITICLLLFYPLLLTLNQKSATFLCPGLLFLTVGLELTFNAFCLIHGTAVEWHYPASSLYTRYYSEIDHDLKSYRGKQQFIRAANLDEVSRNDSLNYQFSSADFFSSMRNRPFEAKMNLLGFKSAGNNLNFSYNNNTLIMDSLMGVKLNLSQGIIDKYGFENNHSWGTDFHVYQNKLAAGTAILSQTNLSQLKFSNQILANQSQLLNAVSDQAIKTKYFSSVTPKLIQVNNTQATKDGKHFYLNAAQDNSLQTLTWQVTVPAQKQAYLNLALISSIGNNGCTVVLNVPQKDLLQTSDMNLEGQDLNLGYYRHARRITFITKIYGSQQMTFKLPQVRLLDIQHYRTATQKLIKNTVNLKYHSHGATGTIKCQKRSWLYTSLPFDPGWKAKINGKSVKVSSVAGIFVTLPLKKGTNHLQLNFVPVGFYPGLVLTILSCLIFGLGELKESLKTRSLSKAKPLLMKK